MRGMHINVPKICWGKSFGSRACLRRCPSLGVEKRLFSSLPSQVSEIPTRQAISDDPSVSSKSNVEMRMELAKKPPPLNPSSASHPNAGSSITFHTVSAQSSATSLVDQLLEHTKSLMQARHHLVAFSGGVDSSLVAALIHELACSNSSPNARAVLGVSPAVPSDQIDLAKYIAMDCIGIDLEIISTTEGTDPTYIENSGEACYACKTHLYTCMKAIVEHYDNAAPAAPPPSRENRNDSQVHYQLYNGTNADDTKDPTRVGLIAASQFHVTSPLSNFTKDQVRLAAKQLGLPNWNYAASPCLRSRIALGVPATQNHLRKIETAERYIKSSSTLRQLGYRPLFDNLRVRLLSNNRARIEIDQELVPIVNDWLLGHHRTSTTNSASTVTISNHAWNTILQRPKDDVSNESSSYIESTTSLQDIKKILGVDSVTIKAFKSGSVAHSDRNDSNLLATYS